MSRIIIAGHSHITALGVPLQSTNAKPALVPLPDTSPHSLSFEGLTGTWPRDKAYWAELMRLGQERPVALLWQGNQYHGTFMFAPDPPVDFVLSEEPSLPLEPGAVLVPELLVRERMSKSLSGLDYILRTMKERSIPRPVLMGSPPPNGDNERLRQYVIGDHFFKEVAEKLGIDIAQARLCAPTLRQKLWRLVQRMTKEVGETYEAPFHPVPSSTRDSEGFLLPQFWGDASHGNGAYGAIVLEDLRARFAPDSPAA